MLAAAAAASSSTAAAFSTTPFFAAVPLGRHADRTLGDALAPLCRGRPGSWCHRRPVRRLLTQAASTASAGGGVVDTALLDAVREKVASMGNGAAWNEAVAVLADATQSTPEEAETCLAKGFGWSMWLAMNRPDYFKPELPQAEALGAGLIWLTSRQGPLRLAASELRAAVAAAPKAYLRSPRASYEDALASAPEAYRAPEAFRALLLRDPRVLELTYDCEGSCAAQCARCWRPSLMRLTGGVLGDVKADSAATEGRFRGGPPPGGGGGGGRVEVGAGLRLWAVSSLCRVRSCSRLSSQSVGPFPKAGAKWSTCPQPPPPRLALPPSPHVGMGAPARIKQRRPCQFPA
mmetsp:Transcript_46465/g.124180  ORF Transcript_46465/g.124180 Transcript_46465/m.124180 type:complete len:348 (-) Transcript_46465:1041-2084(-)